MSTFSIGFESVGGVEGDEFDYSDVIAERFGTDHHQIRIDTDRCCRALDGAIGAMSEPMVSHDCVAFYLLSEEVAKHVKVVQSGQGADEVFAGYHWYPPMAEPMRPRDGVAGTLPQALLRPRPRRRCARWSPTGYVAGRRPQPAFVPAHFARAGRADRPSTPPCGWTPRSCWSTTRSSGSTT